MLCLAAESLADRNENPNCSCSINIRVSVFDCDRQISLSTAHSNHCHLGSRVQGIRQWFVPLRARCAVKFGNYVTYYIITQI